MVNVVFGVVLERRICYSRAKDWINNTGAGVECQETLKYYVNKLCPYYYDVHEVFMDHASSFAAYTSEKNFDDNSESSSESGTDTGSTEVETGTDTAVTDASTNSASSLKSRSTTARKSPIKSGG